MGRSRVEPGGAWPPLHHLRVRMSNDEKLAREGEEILVRTRVTAYAREAVREHAAREELVGHLADDGAPVAVRGGEALVGGFVKGETPGVRRVGELWFCHQY